MLVEWLVQCVDLCLLLLASLAAALAAYGRAPAHPLRVALVSLVAVAVASGLARGRSVYRIASLRQPGRQTRLLIAPALSGTVVATACLFFLGDDTGPDRLWPFEWAAAAIVLQAMMRPVLHRRMQRWHREGRLARRVAIVGVGRISEALIAQLRQDPHGFTLIGLYDDRLSRTPTRQQDVAVMGKVADLLAHSREEPVDIIVIALPLQAKERILQIMLQLESTVADICISGEAEPSPFADRTVAELGGSRVFVAAEKPLKGWRAAKKMLFDRSVSLLLLVVLLPVLLAIAVAVRLDSPGPALFRQPRVGFNNKLFLCYKFRTMRSDMTDLLADRQTTRDDPRITRLGRFLRRTSLDELPQLLNVLFGTMSLVGPRPHAPNTKAAQQLFTDIVARYASRHRVKPGITGWAQVNGWRGQTQTVEQIEKRVAFDLFYIENWSMLLDVRIMVLTVLREFNNKDAF